jgi:hypothetical protein
MRIRLSCQRFEEDGAALSTAFDCSAPGFAVRALDLPVRDLETLFARRASGIAVEAPSPVRAVRAAGSVASAGGVVPLFAFSFVPEIPPAVFTPVFAVPWVFAFAGEAPCVGRLHAGPTSTAAAATAIHEEFAMAQS